MSVELMTLIALAVIGVVHAVTLMSIIGFIKLVDKKGDK